MSYGRVNTPKIYHDLIKFGLAVDWIEPADIVAHKQTLTNFSFQTSTATPSFNRNNKLDFFDGKPTNFTEAPANTQQWGVRINTKLSTNQLAETSFLALLNHNFRDAGVRIRAYVNDSPTNSAGTSFSVNKIVENDATIYGAGVVTADNALGDHYIGYNDSNGSGYQNGWTLIEYPTPTTDNQYLFLFLTPDGGHNTNFDDVVRLGSIVWGESFTFPRSVDMKMTHRINYDEGLVKHRSVAGNDYITASHFGAPTWVSGLPWQNTATNNAEGYFFQQRFGRRSYDFNMSYIDEQELYSPDSSSPVTSDWFDTESFHQMFYNRTLGGSVPFIMNTQSGNASPPDDAFGYYRLTKNSMTAKQVAHRTYNLGFNLEETF
tara:strand:- start:2001 stop:3128 length:1128 start_codon:yes stop_codon:yes gene_type:complete